MGTRSEPEAAQDRARVLVRVERACLMAVLGYPSEAVAAEIREGATRLHGAEGGRLVGRVTEVARRVSTLRRTLADRSPAAIRALAAAHGVAPMA